MQLISCHDGRLLTLEAARLQGGGARTFGTGLAAFDALAPGESFARGAIHELIYEPKQARPLFMATLLARGAMGLARTDNASGEQSGGVLIWADPGGELYPPVLAARGIPLSRLFLLRCKPADQVWSVAECLRCKGVGVTVAALPRLTRVEARRLQLAAESGGGAGVFLRPGGPASEIYAAATRWLVRPAPGERTIQRWTVQLIHGHGGRIGQTVTLEYSRENHLVRAFQTMGNRSGQERKAETVVARAS